MKTLLIGAGAIGGTIAVLAKHAGYDIRLLYDLRCARNAVISAPVFLRVRKPLSHGLKRTVLKLKIPVELLDDIVACVWLANSLTYVLNPL